MEGTGLSCLAHAKRTRARWQLWEGQFRIMPWTESAFGHDILKEAREPRLQLLPALFLVATMSTIKALASRDNHLGTTKAFTETRQLV
jgi:hypothetical protein